MYFAQRGLEACTAAAVLLLLSLYFSMWFTGRDEWLRNVADEWVWSFPVAAVVN